jgi:hypothetical protein
LSDSGENGYISFSYYVYSGDWIRFEYEKDGSVDSREDCAYIRNIRFGQSDIEEETEDSLTLITVISILLSVVFVLLLLALVALPQYQKTARHIQLSRVLTSLDNAARQQQQTAALPGRDPRVWQEEYEGCERINPQKLSCQGFELILQPGGVTALARSEGMDIIYSLFYPFDGGPISCEAQTRTGAELCRDLKIP